MNMFEPLTTEMIKNTMSFVDYCYESSWRKEIEKRQSMFEWFLNPDFIHEPQPFDKNTLTETEVEWIEERFRRINPLTGDTTEKDWFTPWRHIVKTRKNPSLRPKVTEEEK
jgi:hypothetical protein